MRVIIAALLLLTGCADQYMPAAKVRAQRIGDGLHVVSEFTLSDGTRCAAISGSTITCDWGCAKRPKE